MARPISVGDIVCVTWPESRHGIVIPGTFEGRVIAKQDALVTVHFEYAAYMEQGSIRTEDEDIKIDLAKGFHTDYGEVVKVKRCGKKRK